MFCNVSSVAGNQFRKVCGLTRITICALQAGTAVSAIVPLAEIHTSPQTGDAFLAGGLNCPDSWVGLDNHCLPLLDWIEFCHIRGVASSGFPSALMRMQIHGCPLLAMTENNRCR
jgi:hypothetical protein